MRNFKLFFPVLPVTLASLFLLFSSCGLQDITAVFEDTQHPSYNTLIQDTGFDPSLRYFDFNTGSQPTDLNNTAGFLGTAVYYKIYNSLATLQTESNSVTGSQTSTSLNGTGFNRLISFGYQPLNLDANKNFYFSTTPARVRLRLYDESYFPATNSYILPAGIDDVASPVFRSVNTKGFNFYRDPTDTSRTRDPTPLESDADVRFTSPPPEPDTWYVNAFAVAVAQDYNTFMSIYSRAAYLGYIQIKQ
ncbi:MAG: hypothetical protein Ta2A_26140 [Treponemataceae bacterium]|nr:MAG: hypothetical protein Ta2A_26140 [Treponemataceae bacterium]